MMLLPVCFKVFTFHGRKRFIMLLSLFSAVHDEWRVQWMMMSTSYWWIFLCSVSFYQLSLPLCPIALSLTYEDGFVFVIHVVLLSFHALHLACSDSLYLPYSFLIVHCLASRILCLSLAPISLSYQLICSFLGREGCQWQNIKTNLLINIPTTRGQLTLERYLYTPIVRAFKS